MITNLLSMKYTIPITSHQLFLNRIKICVVDLTGRRTLCSRCNAEDGFYPRVYSFDVTYIQCTNGTSNWWKYVLSAYLLLTLFYFVILCFKISIHSSHIQGYIIYSQIFAWPPFIRSVYIISIKTCITYDQISWISVWNLESWLLSNVQHWHLSANR